MSGGTDKRVEVARLGLVVVLCPGMGDERVASEDKIHLRKQGSLIGPAIRVVVISRFRLLSSTKSLTMTVP